MNATTPVRAAAVLLLAAVASFAQRESALPEYQVIDLGGSEWGQAFANDVNAYRVAVGAVDVGDAASGARHAVRWDANGTRTDLTPGSNVVSAAAEAVNDAGVVVGDRFTDDAEPDGGFRWIDGVLTMLPSSFQQFARGVDERGYVVGQAHTPAIQFEPTVWAPDLSLVQLGTLGGVSGSANDMDGWGRVVGRSALEPTGFESHAFLWRGGALLDLGVLPAGGSSTANALNNRGEVVGSSGPFVQEHAFRWTAARGMVDLGDLGFEPRSSALDVNDGGTIVGYSWRADGQVATIWIDGELHDLNALIDPDSGWRLTQANAINERGDVVGFGSHSSGGGVRAFLATRKDGGDLATVGPNPGLAGRPSTVEVVGATPDAVVFLAVGVSLDGASVPGCRGVTLDVAAPIVLTSTADAGGTAAFGGTFPPETAGQAWLFQSVEPATCRVSNLVVRIVE